MIRALLLVLGVAAAGYAAILAWLVRHEDQIVFQPERGPVPVPLLAEGEPIRPVRFPSGDGTPLTAWVLPPPSTEAPGRWVLVLHGNAGNLATPGRPEHDAQLRRLGLGVLALDYRGYGLSGGTPSEAGLYADATAAYRYLRDTLGVLPGRIVVYGHSLGSGVAVELATRVEAAGLILEGAFTSVPDRAAEVYPWLPVRWIGHNRFPSLARIGSVRMPVLIIHGRDDQTIPIDHGRRLFAAAPARRTFLEVAGGHDDAFQAGAPEYEAGIRQFLAGLP